MRIAIRREDFSTEHYKLSIGDGVLEFARDAGGFSLPLCEIKDFCVTEDGRGKAYFTTLCGGRMYDGEIFDRDGIKPFTEELKKRLGGVINIEVRKN